MREKTWWKKRCVTRLSVPFLHGLSGGENYSHITAEDFVSACLLAATVLGTGKHKMFLLQRMPIQDIQSITGQSEPEDNLEEGSRGLQD